MKLTMLGTGHASVRKCYNTCFVISEEANHFLVDAGGGNGILTILDEEKIEIRQIHDMFVSHAHTDHMLGAIWMIRIIGHDICNEKYEGDFRVYCHKELTGILMNICEMTLLPKVLNLFGNRIRFITVEDGDVHKVLGRNVRFFDIHSTKIKQFGFSFDIEGELRLGFCGDEPLTEETVHNVEGCRWLMHEAFCLYSERDIFQPYRKHHSTVKDACEMAERLKVENLILYHTEETHLQERKKLYSEEGKAYFRGNLFVPNDREQIVL